MLQNIYEVHTAFLIQAILQAIMTKLNIYIYVSHQPYFHSVVGNVMSVPHLYKKRDKEKYTVDYIKCSLLRKLYKFKSSEIFMIIIINCKTI
jgi:hypothetical protein